MAYTVTIKYTGVSGEVAIGAAPIARLWNPDGSYIDSVAYEGTVYDTNVAGFGEVPAVAPYDSTSIPYPVALAQFKLATVGNDNEVTFDVEDYKEAFFYKTLGEQMADQGFEVTVGVKGPQIVLAALDENETPFDVPVSDYQSDVIISNGNITGTLNYVSTGSVATTWGEGNFLALAFSDVPDGAIVKVGLDPSVSSGLVELDADKAGVFKITDKNTQVFVVETNYQNVTTRQTFGLAGLTCLTA